MEAMYKRYFKKTYGEKTYKRITKKFGQGEMLEIVFGIIYSLPKNSKDLSTDLINLLEEYDKGLEPEDYRDRATIEKFYGVSSFLKASQLFLNDLVEVI